MMQSEQSDSQPVVRGQSSSPEITPHEAKYLRIALAFGDPATDDLPDPDLESAKAKLAEIERGGQDG